MAFSPPAPRSALGRIFVGRDGIRAGWSLLIFALVVAALSFVIYLVRRPLALPPVLTPGSLLLGESLALASILAATAVMAWIEGRAAWSYGLGGPHPAPRFCAGWAAGLASLSAGVAAMAATGHLAFDGLSLDGVDAAAYGLAWLTTFAVQSATEETLFRGYVQTTLARGIGFWPAAVLLSALFGAVHIGNIDEDAVGAATAGVAGLMFCVLLRASGSLWLGLGLHAGWNWAESFLYGTANGGIVIAGHMLATRPEGGALLSGGSAGPEASLIAGPMIVVGALVVVAALRRGGQSETSLARP